MINNFLLQTSTNFSDLITKCQRDWDKNDLCPIVKVPTLKDQLKEITKNNTFKYEEREIENKYNKIYQQNFVPMRHYEREERIKPEKIGKSCDRDPDLFLQNLIRDQELIQSQKTNNPGSFMNEKNKKNNKFNPIIMKPTESGILTKMFSANNNKIIPDLEKEFKSKISSKNSIPIKIVGTSPKIFEFTIDVKKYISASELKTIIAKNLEKKKCFDEIRINCSDFGFNLENNILLDQSEINFEELIRNNIKQIFKTGSTFVILLNLCFNVKFHEKFNQKNTAFSKIFREEEIAVLENDENNSKKANKIKEKDDFIPVLTKNYKTKPDYEFLKKMDRKQLENVKNFEISNEFGKIRFNDPLDLTNINLDNVHIEKGKIFIDKIESEMKKLNNRGELEMYGINVPKDINSDKGFSSFVEVLSERCFEIGVILFLNLGKIYPFREKWEHS